MKERGASPACQHRRHREVKTFFSWCRRMDYVADNVFAKVPLVRLEQQIRPLCDQKMSFARISRGETLVLVMQSAQDRTTHDLALAPGR